MNRTKGLNTSRAQSTLLQNLDSIIRRAVMAGFQKANLLMAPEQRRLKDLHMAARMQQHGREYIHHQMKTAEVLWLRSQAERGVRV